MANILYQLDIISSDKPIETSGLDLTGEYVGQTKKKVTDILDMACGSVLFIDEAYELGKGIYGWEAMTTILAAMTDPRYSSLVIIIAGYEKDIDSMLNMNPGLKSRFTQYFNFEDWLQSDCQVFFLNLAKRDNYILEDGIDEMLLENFEKLRNRPGFGNGRDVNRIWTDSLNYSFKNFRSVKQCRR